MSSEVYLRLKITLMGDMGVGKTSLRRRYLSDDFLEGYMGTIGVETASKDIEIQGKKINIQIWDLAGHHQFSSVRSIFYQGSLGVVLVYDVMNRESYDNSMYWVEEMLNSTKGDPIPLMIIGNKIDLREALLKSDPTDVDFVRTIDGLELKSRIEKRLHEYHGQEVFVDFHETSAKTGEGVLDSFTAFVGQILPKSVSNY